MKKTFASIILAAVSTATCLGLTACGGSGYSETYTGTLSETEYATKQEAAQGFWETEIVADTTKYRFMGYRKEADMTEEEISALNLGESEAKPVAAEVGGVSYYDKIANVTAHMILESRKLYILDYNNSFRYYSPEVEVGETLTASYLNSVLNPENYKSCTFIAELVVYVDNGFGTINLSIKVNNEYAYFNKTETEVLNDGTVVRDEKNEAYYFPTTSGCYEIARHIRTNFGRTEYYGTWNLYDSDVKISELVGERLSYSVANADAPSNYEIMKKPKRC